MAQLLSFILGGGNFITQSAPTNFHTFHTRLQLTPGTSASDWREVTAAERAKIEAADAKWVRPPQSFIDRWNELCNFNVNLSPWGIKETIGRVGKYNESTGYCELNGITNIDYTEALRIRSYWIGRKIPDPKGLYYQMPERTLLPLNFSNGSAVSAYWLFNSCNNLEEVTILLAPSSDIRGIFSNCKKLRKINGIIYPYSETELGGAFINCYELEEVRVFNLCRNISFADSPKLSLESISYMINKSFFGKQPSPITITLHPEAYARLTDELIAAAAEKQITFATTE